MPTPFWSLLYYDLKGSQLTCQVELKLLKYVARLNAEHQSIQNLPLLTIFVNYT